MRPILAGTETEYGLLVKGRGAEEQIDDAMALVRSYPGECFVGWDYCYESPRSDLRGFVLGKLDTDPIDARFDRGRRQIEPHEVRSDRILPNGARLYNDHGHPEYATPECRSLNELALQDKAGELAVLAAAKAWSNHTGIEAKLFKNNTDFHGASYGSHESYLVPRELGFERLYRAVTPILVARTILCGAGKVGSESGATCTYQLSQRADFFVESANAETLYRRPVFNTRDEPHADARHWIRLHVISGDANMIASCVRRRVGLVKLAIALEEVRESPAWSLRDPVRAFRDVSRDETYQFRIELSGSSWTTAYEVIESYLAAAERHLELDQEMKDLVAECKTLLACLRERDLESVRASIDWAAKLHMLESFMSEANLTWRDHSLRSFDLEYHNVDPEEGLFHALEQIGEVELTPDQKVLADCLEQAHEDTRAMVRGAAVRNFSPNLLAACWRTITLDHEGQAVEIDLPPQASYDSKLTTIKDVGTFIQMLRGEP